MYAHSYLHCRLQLKHMVMLVQMLLPCVLRLLFNRYSCPDYSLKSSDEMEAFTCMFGCVTRFGKKWI